MKRLSHTLFILLLGYNGITNAEISGVDDSQVSETSSPSADGTCTSNQIRENQTIINNCNRNWEQWGIDPPPESEMRQLNDCSGVLSAESALACGDAILALPIFFGQMAALGIAASMPINRNTLAYVSQNGSLDEIKAFLTGEFFKEICGLAPWEVPTHAETSCPTRESHINQEAHTLCRRQAVARIQSFNTCRSAPETRALYRERRSQIESRAQQIKAEQDRRRALEERRENEISRITSVCRGEMNALTSTATLLLAPPLWLHEQFRTRVMPSQAEVQAYTNCVERETEGNNELREELIHAADGIMAQISRSFSSLKCYNGRVRKQLMCEVAIGVLTGGAGLTAYAVKRLGRRGAQELAEFTGREGAEEIAEETVEEVVEEVAERTAPASGYPPTGNPLIDRPIGTPRVNAIRDFEARTGRSVEVHGPITRDNGEVWTLIRDSETREPLFYFKREDPNLDTYNGEPMLPSFYVHSATIRGTREYNPAYQGQGFNSFLFNRFVTENPSVNLVSVNGLLDTNRNVMEGLISEGYSAIDAFRATPAYRIRAENGFTEIIPESIVYDESGAIESLVMRRPTN